MPRRYPAEVCHQVIELARSGTKVASRALPPLGLGSPRVVDALAEARLVDPTVVKVKTRDDLVRRASGVSQLADAV